MTETFEPIAPVTWLYIQHSWGSCYWIHRNGGCWSARRKDQQGMFTATSAEDLLTKIRDDYAERPIPRLALPATAGGLSMTAAASASRQATVAAIAHRGGVREVDSHLGFIQVGDYQLGNWFVMLSLTQVPQVMGHLGLTVSDR